MTNSHIEPSIPERNIVFVRLIRDALRKDPNLSEEELRRGIIIKRRLPLNMNDGFWKVRERSYRGEMRERRHLFNERFDLAMKKIRDAK